MKNVKELALECILLTMNKIKHNLESCSFKEDVEVNSNAMLNLARAFEIIDNTQNHTS